MGFVEPATGGLGGRLPPARRRARPGLTEEDLQALGAVPRRWWHRRIAVTPPGVIRQYLGDHVLGHRVQIALGSGQTGVAEHPLHIGQRHLRVARHPIRRGVTQIVQRPVRPQHRVGPIEHDAGCVIAQRPQRFPQGPPQRLVPRPGPLRPTAPDTTAATRTHPARRATAASPECPCGSP